MLKLNWPKLACILSVCLLAAATAAPAQTFTTLYSFCVDYQCPDGDYPSAGLAQGTSGDLYGAAQNGGAYNAGTLFKITPTGTQTTLLSFGNGITNASNPDHALVLGTDGNFYGASDFGGNHFTGTVFEITASGSLNVLYSFCSQGGGGCTDGVNPCFSTF